MTKTHLHTGFLEELMSGLRNLNGLCGLCVRMFRGEDTPSLCPPSRPRLPCSLGMLRFSARGDFPWPLAPQKADIEGVTYTVYLSCTVYAISRHLPRRGLHSPRLALRSGDVGEGGWDSNPGQRATPHHLRQQSRATGRSSSRWRIAPSLTTVSSGAAPSCPGLRAHVA